MRGAPRHAVGLIYPRAYP